MRQNITKIRQYCRRTLLEIFFKVSTVFWHKYTLNGQNMMDSDFKIWSK